MPYRDGDSDRRGGGGESDAGKIFLGGLSWETTVDDLRDYFEKFGSISEATVKTDPSTGRSKGYGFVVFSDPSVVDKVLAEGTVSLQGRTVDPQRATGRPGGRGGGGIKKVFVGGVEPDVSESEIREHFSVYGTVEDIHMPVDRETNERRPFVFVTFESVQSADDACDEPNHTLGGKEVSVKKANPKGDSGFGRGGGRGGGYGGRGGGYGGGYGGSRSGGGYGGGRNDSYGGGRSGGGNRSGGGSGRYDSGGYGGGGRSGGGGSRGRGGGGGYGNDFGSRYQPYGRS